MESRFAHLRERDTSVSMMRVKMSRRRSQTQKENRERTVNSRRQLENLPELELSSMDASIAMAVNNTKPAKNVAADERLKQLERWKERKALEKEKEKREKERKGVFKTGVYHPKNHAIAASLPLAPAAPTRVRETRVTPAQSQTTRVTRSMKQQQQVQKATLVKPMNVHDANAVAKKAVPALEQPTRGRVAPVKAAPPKTKGKACPVEPIRALPTRSTTRSTAPAQQDKLKDNPAGVRATRSKAIVKPLPSFSDRKRDCEETEKTDVQTAVLKEPEAKKQPENELVSEDNVLPDSVPAGDPAQGPSFAPQGFVFQAPSGLSSFKFEPLTPRSNDASLKPSVNFSFPPAPVSNVQHQAEPSQASPRCSPPRTPTAVAPPTPASPAESKHDVPYFRSEIANETERLTSLCGHWEAKVEDESIPEEMRDRMRTAIGQARLLMKERFKQFGGLVDDCEFARGEKITTCTDLQGFWDMVYFQVEDVNKKFEALKDAESRGWAEERKPPPRQKKVVKKPVAAGPSSKPAGATAAAKSRLAAAKAAMKAKQRAAKEDGEEPSCSDAQEPQPQGAPPPGSSLPLDEGFSRVHSPLKPPASFRRSSRLSAAVLPQPSPSSSSSCCLSTRSVTRQSLTSVQTPGRSATPLLHTPAERLLTPKKTPAKAQKSQPGTPQLSRSTTSPVTEEVSKVSPAVVCQAPETSACLSFTLSPCGTPTPAPASSPPTTVEARGSACRSAQTSIVEDMPGLDFERYLQPSLRCSPSPAGEVDMETLSPMTTLSPMAPDVEMESPKGQSEELQARQETAVPLVSALPPPKSQAADAALLLFTPDPKDRIRQSVCPSDLMVFTPPL